MNGIPLILGWKLEKRGPVIPIRPSYRTVRVEGLAAGDSITIWGLVKDGEIKVGYVVSDGVWELRPLQGIPVLQAELRGQNGSDAFVWVE